VFTAAVFVAFVVATVPLLLFIRRRVRTRRPTDNLGPVSERWLLGHRAEDQ